MNRIILVLFIAIISSSSINAHPGIGIVKDSKDNIYYTDLTHVWKITPDGNRIIAVKNVHTHQLYIDEIDNLYGEHEYYKGEENDKWGNYVWCLSKDGTFEIVVPETEGFLENNTLVRDSKGNSYWIKNVEEILQIYVESPSGNNSLVTTDTFQDVRWMHFSNTNNCLYVVDNLKIKKITAFGKVETIATNLKSKSPAFSGVSDHHYIFGITTDTKMNVYAAIFGSQKIIKIDSSGLVTKIYESETEWSPCGILMGSNDEKWIMEFSKNNKTRVVKIDSNGIKQIFAD